MAKEHSFDITAEIDRQELKNALDQAKREVSTRYDFKGLTAEYDYNEAAKTITILAASDNKADTMFDILISKAIKRGISPKALNEHSRDQVGHGNTKLVVAITDVISKEDAKKIVKAIKDQKLKVQAQIRGEEVRVMGKSIDDLQKCIAAVKALDLDVPLNFTNLK
ncbi:MAG: YajQ family cyclic di-GMP-binding protein [Campylobacteraceae bacterium 4484_4]|nr:MAG: YajQ family cyclic di-GMP-binding protein [Campylobacteraceae bacterium 4484_4]